MSRYIDADLIEYEPMCRARGNGMYEDCEIAHKDQIDDIPTADVVEVVRCADCKWFQPINNGDHGFCGTPFHGAEVYEDDYCSDGERRQDG